MVNFTIEKPPEKIYEFILTKSYYIINGNKTYHNKDLSDFIMYDFNILKDSILVTLFKQENLIKS